MIPRAASTIRNLLRFNQPLYHFKINFPLTPSRMESCLSKLRYAKSQDPYVLALSINATFGNKSHYNLIYDSFLDTAQTLRIPLYTFIEDQATTEGYALACCGTEIYATPYSIIGEIGSYKSYLNFEKLLTKLGIKYEELGIGKSSFWNHFKEQRQEENQFTADFVESLSENMVHRIHQRRAIDTDSVRALKGKLISPKEALRLKLIDKIGTFGQFKNIHYPNYKVVEYSFEKRAYNIQLSSNEQKVIKGLIQITQMKTPQMYLLDTHLLEQLFQIVQARFKDVEFMQFLEQELAPTIIDLLDVNLQQDSLRMM